MSAASFTVVQAAAGCGKTTDLARRYLSLVADGVPVDQTVAITFTRKAAAELQERVTLALRACLPGPVAEQARARLGAAWPLYREAAPRDEQLVRRALAALPDAPIGTTDSFIQGLLTELALDAVLPLPGGGRAWLDVPIRAGTSLGGALERAARRLLDPPRIAGSGGATPLGGPDLAPDVALLTRYLSLSEILRAISHRSAHDHLPVASAAQVLGAVAVAAAEVLRRHDLAEAYGVRDPGSEEAWRETLHRRTLAAGRWAVAPVARWIRDGAIPSEAPAELVGWLRGLDARGRARKEIRAELEREQVDLGIVRLPLRDAVEALRHPFEEPAHVRLADRLREALERLRAQVIDEGLRAAVEAGELGHDELAEAAIALCEHPPPRLCGKFRALLVDEVQDANPTQLRLYRALASLPGPEPVRAYFVGDSRQSIYMFRHAEPGGFRELVAQARREGGQVVPLEVNHRSAPELVEAHKHLFDGLAEPLRREGLEALEPLTRLRAAPANAALSLGAEDAEPEVALQSPHDAPAPVWLVRGEEGERLVFREADVRALRTFWERVGARWTRDTDSAAVLAPTWSKAQEACALLRRWAGRDDVAFVEGGSGPAEGRVPTDLRHLLQALLDPTDDIAWLGVFKHPAVGLSEAALARARAGVGLRVRAAEPGRRGAWEEAPPWTRRLGNLIDVDRLVEPHTPADRLAFERAAGPLRAAREQLGRADTATILDQLIHTLGWRAIYAAGPGGTDDLALLEVLLDRVRGLASDGVDPHAILAALSDREAADAPQVHVDRPARYIACTTVFQAKGRAWDHVMVWSPGRPPRAGISADPPVTWVRLGEGPPRRLVGLRFDPVGGMSPFRDPLGRLAARVEQRRYAEECVRLAYVALTRARRSVTLGLPDLESRCDRVQWLLARVWGAPDFCAPGVATVRRGPLPEADPLPTGWAAPASPEARYALPRLEQRTWVERAPSSAAAELPAPARLQQAEWIRGRVLLGGGLHLGGAPVDPPPLPDVASTTWGELAHGWFAWWGLRSEPSPELAAEYLAREWSVASSGSASSEGLCAAPAVRDWLVAMSHGLGLVGGPLWDLVRDGGSRLHFEVPFVGLGGAAPNELLLSGRMDLLVEGPRGVTVIDFKAGARAPTGFHDLVEGAGLRTYGPQLEAYRAALERMGYAVDRVALWFVRTGTSVIW